MSACSAPNASPYPKDAINDFVVDGVAGAVNPDRTGTKVAAHHVLELDPGASAQIRVRLTAGAKLPTDPLGQAFDRALSTRKAEADTFYATVIPPVLTADQALVMRQALAGLLWGKQYYEYDVHRWLREHGVDPWGPNAPSSGVRNVQWFHMLAGDIISMPDKWEYPWFAAWDLAFHCGPLSLVDIDFAKEQVELLLKTRYLHPNGQIPAYEWNFSDVNPPVTPWAALYVYEREAEIRGEGDRVFLARVFDRLLTDFTGGSTARIQTTATCSKAGSLDWTTSGSSTARRRCPAAANSSRPMGPRGWPSTASGCSRSRSSCPASSPPTSTWRSSSAALHVVRRDEPAGGRLDAVGRPRRVLRRRDANAGRVDDRARRCARWSGCSRCAPRPCSSPTSSIATR